MSRVPAVGDTVEDFTLPDETGTPRRLSELLADGPVVLFFYPPPSPPAAPRRPVTSATWPASSPRSARGRSV